MKAYNNEFFKKWIKEQLRYTCWSYLKNERIRMKAYNNEFFKKWIKEQLRYTCWNKWMRTKAKETNDKWTNDFPGTSVS